VVNKGFGGFNAFFQQMEREIPHLLAGAGLFKFNVFFGLALPWFPSSGDLRSDCWNSDSAKVSSNFPGHRFIQRAELRRSGIRLPFVDK
jgi:hypothetical protein